MNESQDSTKRSYQPPQLEDFGTVADLTQVGDSSPGGDCLPPGAKGNDGGSVMHTGISC